MLKIPLPVGVPEEKKEEEAGRKYEEFDIAFDKLADKLDLNFKFLAYDKDVTIGTKEEVIMPLFKKDDDEPEVVVQKKNIAQISKFIGQTKSMNVLWILQNLATENLDRNSNC